MIVNIQSLYKGCSSISFRTQDKQAIRLMGLDMFIRFDMAAHFKQLSGKLACLEIWFFSVCQILLKIS